MATPSPIFYPPVTTAQALEQQRSIAASHRDFDRFNQLWTSTILESLIEGYWNLGDDWRDVLLLDSYDASLTKIGQIAWRKANRIARTYLTPEQDEAFTILMTVTDFDPSNFHWFLERYTRPYWEARKLIAEQSSAREFLRFLIEKETSKQVRAAATRRLEELG